MKRKIVAFILSLGIIFSLSACGETVKNNYGEEVQKFGPYIEISHENGKDSHLQSVRQLCRHPGM